MAANLGTEQWNANGRRSRYAVSSAS